MKNTSNEGDGTSCSLTSGNFNTLLCTVCYLLSHSLTSASFRTQKYLAVDSKCSQCTELEMEGEKLNQAGKDELKKLYAYHHEMYMGQRIWYHDVRERSFRESTDDPKVRKLIRLILLYLTLMLSFILYFPPDDLTDHRWCCTSLYVHTVLRQIRCGEQYLYFPPNYITLP